MLFTNSDEIVCDAIAGGNAWYPLYVGTVEFLIYRESNNLATTNDK